MNKILKLFSIITLTLFGLTLRAQSSDKEAAIELKRKAFDLEDNQGKYDEAIKLLEAAQKLDPENSTYTYEIAYAYSGKKEHKKSSDILEKILNKNDAYGRYFQQLGNEYDYQGLPKKAIETYEKGIKKFPNYGGLYLERGNMFLPENKYAEALPYYEKGIELDPKFASNYYWASKIYCSSTESVWGLIYGEIFINLEQTSKRTTEISKKLFETYKKNISLESDTSFGVTFSKNNIINLSDLKDVTKFKLPFGTGCYEFLMITAIFGEKSINLRSLDSIRSRFIKNYFSKDFPQKYPNVLFDYQKKIKEAGHFDAYNYFILSGGDTESFQDWIKNNKEKWTNFTVWFSKNELKLDDLHRFYRKQY